MNNPEYFLVDIFQELVNATKAALALPELNYQYGYIEELQETLVQWSKTQEWAEKKYPLIWLRQPFRILRGQPAGYYGSVDGLSFFVINQTKKDSKAADRMTDNFKPILYPIYREMLKQINQHQSIGMEYNERSHTLTDRYYWGENQQKEITDAVDVLEISELKLIIHDNQNC